MSKILYAASSISHINNFHLPYIERLRSEGHTVKVMATGKEADYNLSVNKDILSPKSLFIKSKIKRILEEEKFDVLIVSGASAAFHVRSAVSKKNRPKIINIVNGYPFSQGKAMNDRFLLSVEKRLAKRTDAVLAMNEEDSRIATEKRLAGKVKRIYGMGAQVAEQKFDVEIIRRYTTTGGKYLMCSVGEISSRKNQRFLICALPEIKLAIPNAALLFVGAGAEEMGLRDLAYKLGVDSSVHFTGKRNNPCDFIRASDIYVSASKYEGMPFNVIEALGCQKPILVSDIKGHRELIENGSEGFLFESGNITDFANKVKKIYNGEFVCSSEQQRARYEKYCFSAVFDKTYKAISEELV